MRTKVHARQVARNIDNAEESPSFTGWMGWGIAIFVVALALRLIHLVQILPAPFFPFKMGDAASYDIWARQIASGEWLGREVFYQAPLYPYFLALVYRVVGDDMFSIRLTQTLLGALSCVLLAGAGGLIFSKRTGILSGFLLAAFAPALFYDSLVQKSVLDTLLLCLILLLCGALMYQPRAWLWSLLGVAVGGLILTRENALVLLPAILLWLVLLPPLATTRPWKWSAWFLAGVALVLLPVALRNYALGGGVQLTTSQLGPNLYIGNNPRANGSYQPLRPRRGSARYERLDATRLAEEDLQRPLSPAEVSRYWRDQAFQFMRRQPEAWLRLMWRKFVYTWNATELVDTEDQYTYAEWSWLLRLSGYVLHFGVLLPLAVWGMCCTAAQHRRLLPLYLIILFYALSVVAFYVVGRYRYPLVPPLILFAAAGLAEARQFVRQGPWWKVGLAVLVCAAVAVFANQPIVSRDSLRAITHYNVGVELDAEGLHDLAVLRYEATLRLDPTFQTVYNNLGCDYLHLGDYERAIEHLRLAVHADPEFAEASYNLGTAYLAKEDFSAARDCFQRAVNLRPDLPRAYLGLGMAYQRLGQLSEARAALQQALALDPDNREVKRELEQLDATSPLQ